MAERVTVAWQEKASVGNERAVNRRSAIEDAARLICTCRSTDKPCPKTRQRHHGQVTVNLNTRAACREQRMYCPAQFQLSLLQHRIGWN